MYLSALLINSGGDPGRERPARHWLRNLYRLHQRLSMAFPSGETKAADPFFLAPYDPARFAQALEPGRHKMRSASRGFLFRVDHRPNGQTVIVAQSAILPDWEYAFQNTNFLAAKPECRPYDTRFDRGAYLRFRLLANPTKKVDTISKSERTNPAPVHPLARKQLDGRRVPVADDMLAEWLMRHAAGCHVCQIDSVTPGYVLMRKDQPRGAGIRLRSALYNGVLRVEDSAVFQETITQGIGPAKAFGFGLLSVAPIRGGPHETA